MAYYGLFTAIQVKLRKSITGFSHSEIPFDFARLVMVVLFECFLSVISMIVS